MQLVGNECRIAVPNSISVLVYTMQGARGHKTATGRMTFRSSEPTFDLMSGIEQCITWIEAVLEEPLVTSDSFALSLKSGIALCK